MRDAETESASVLSVQGLSKDYGTVRVVSDISLDFRSGSIHALLGENGAGKSTLIKMLSGVITPSEGEILVDGKRHQLRSVRDGQNLGIVALPQEQSLVPTLGVAENIYLGVRRPDARILVHRRTLNRDASELLAGLGQRLPLDVPVAELSAVQQTMVALARALARDARVLILDEPTAALTDTETEQLFTVLRSLRDSGTAILYVSHRLEEVFEIADTATVMRNGSKVWTRAINETSTGQVVAAMIGREQAQLYPSKRASQGEVRLQLRDLVGHTLRGVSLDVGAGSVLGIAGLAGSGRSELLKIIAGAQRARSGRVLLDGEDLTGLSVAATMTAGIALVPEERRSQGLIMNASIQANIALPNFRSLSSLGVMRRARERQTAQRQSKELKISSVSVHQPVAELSGGNQQKVVLAKYLERRPRVLLLDEPTRGIDVGTKVEIYQLIRRLTTAGVAVVVVSSELPELIGLSDEIAVLNEGRLTELVNAAAISEESLLQKCYRKPE